MVKLISGYGKPVKDDTFSVFVIVIYFQDFTRPLIWGDRIHDFISIIGREQALLTEKYYYFYAIAPSPDPRFAGALLSCYNTLVH